MSLRGRNRERLVILSEAKDLNFESLPGANLNALESTLVDLLILKDFKLFRMSTYTKTGGGSPTLSTIQPIALGAGLEQ